MLSSRAYLAGSRRVERCELCVSSACCIYLQSLVLARLHIRRGTKSEREERGSSTLASNDATPVPLDAQDACPRCSLSAFSSLLCTRFRRWRHSLATAIFSSRRECMLFDRIPSDATPNPKHPLSPFPCHALPAHATSLDCNDTMSSNSKNKQQRLRNRRSRSKT